MLIGNLADDSFIVREEASISLRKLDCVSVPYLRAATKHPDMEVRRRAEMLLADWRGSIKPTNHSETPWLDMLPNDYPDRREILDRCLSNARQIIQNGTNWPEYRWATQLLIDELLAAGKSKSSIIKLLDEMGKNEKEYIRKHAPPEVNRGGRS